MQQRDLAYRFYVTDALWILCENSAKQSGGRYMSARFCDLVEGRAKKAETRSGEEIALDVITRIGLEVTAADESV